ncbi:unnamed protein product [Linum trigynum]|uniref:RING-type E3 ubiquitin transferase n=1 Tax=Linum trigynum TaxID=586398 RepID=A0AAV2G779_9ROSI
MSRTTTAAGANLLASGFHYDPVEEVMIGTATLPPNHRCPAVNRFPGTPGRFPRDQLRQRREPTTRTWRRDSDVLFMAPAVGNLGNHYPLQQGRRILVQHDPEEESILIFDAISPPPRLSEEAPDLAADQWFRTTPASDSAIEGLERVEAGAATGDCRICLEEMVGGSGDGGGTQELIRMPCAHLFHESCAVSWLKTSNFCPLCRFQIPAPDR